MNISLIHGMRGIGLRALSGSTATSGFYESCALWLMLTQIVILDSDHLWFHKQCQMPEKCCGCLAKLLMFSLPLMLGGQLWKLSTVFRKLSFTPSLFSRTSSSLALAFFSLIISLPCPLRSARGLYWQMVCVVFFLTYSTGNMASHLTSLGPSFPI